MQNKISFYTIKIQKYFFYPKLILFLLLKIETISFKLQIFTWPCFKYVRVQILNETIRNN